MFSRLAVIAACVMFATTAAIAQSSGSINAPDNKGIITDHQTGGTNIINRLPPRIPLGLYQNQQQIGLVKAYKISTDGTQILFTNPRISSGTVDFNSTMEFQHYMISCPALKPPGNVQAAFTSSLVIGNVECEIVGKR